MVDEGKDGMVWDDSDVSDDVDGEGTVSLVSSPGAVEEGGTVLDGESRSGAVV
jgi:hypothetical protein